MMTTMDQLLSLKITECFDPVEGDNEIQNIKGETERIIMTLLKTNTDHLAMLLSGKITGSFGPLEAKDGKIQYINREM